MTQQDNSPEKIQQDIRNTRGSIDQKLGELQDRLSAGQLIDQAIEFAKDGSGEFGKNLGRVVRENPIPVALLGASVAWLAVSSARKSPKHQRENAPADPANYGRARSTGRTDYAASRDYSGAAQSGGNRDTSGDTGGSLKQKAAALAGQARDRVADLGSGTKQTLGAAKERTVELAHDVRERSGRAKVATQDFIHERPLTTVALGLAVGAVLAAAFPVSRRENETFGETSDDLKQTVKETASEQIDKAKDAAKEVANAATQEVKHQAHERGLTGSTASSETAAPRQGSSGSPATGRPGSSSGTGTTANVNRPAPGSAAVGGSAGARPSATTPKT